MALHQRVMQILIPLMMMHSSFTGKISLLKHYLLAIKVPTKFSEVLRTDQKPHMVGVQRFLVTCMQKDTCMKYVTKL